MSGIFISFNDEWDAIRFWRENIENASATDCRRGAVVVKNVRETHAEAETARLDFLLTEQGIPRFSAACLKLADDGDDWPTRARRAIDAAREAPKEVTTVIWPVDAGGCRG